MRRHVKIDYVGALLVAVVAALPMLWVTFAGSDYAWISWQSGAYLVGFLAAVVTLVVVVELRVSEPMVPLRILNNRTTILMILASLGVGMAMFGSSTFLTQYFQLGGGYTPTRAGLMTIPLIISQLLVSTLGGQLVSRTGRWKPLMVVGVIALLAGLLLMGTIDHTTPYWHVAIFMSIMGVGIGALVQNIVLAVQNTVDVTPGRCHLGRRLLLPLARRCGRCRRPRRDPGHPGRLAGPPTGPPRHRRQRGRGRRRVARPQRPAGPGRRPSSGPRTATRSASCSSSPRPPRSLTLVTVFLVKEVPLRNTIEMQPAAAGDGTAALAEDTGREARGLEGPTAEHAAAPRPSRPVRRPRPSRTATLGRPRGAPGRRGPGRARPRRRTRRVRTWPCPARRRPSS